MSDPRQKDFDERHTKLPVVTALTKREYFAAIFMQSMVAGEGARMVADRDKRYDETNWKEVVALNAIEFADELIKQLAK